VLWARQFTVKSRVQELTQGESCLVVSLQPEGVASHKLHQVVPPFCLALTHMSSL
jgi:hypothetical protein